MGITSLGRLRFFSSSNKRIDDHVKIEKTRPFRVQKAHSALWTKCKIHRCDCLIKDYCSVGMK